MPDLFEIPDPLHESYARVYDVLAELRESFHRSGRLDDSNAKLDEVAKLFATYLAFKNSEISQFPGPEAEDLVGLLQTAFSQAARLPQYQLADGTSVFGPQPALAVREGDEQLAGDLVRLVRNSIDTAFELRDHGCPFDILNEAFGHFVRDNFRGNVEDAQYMTPPEVVDFMADLVLYDIGREDGSSSDPGKQWTVVDPTCGVGSFLAAVYNRARQSDWLDVKRLRLFGQDKVERMVRLSTINLELFDSAEHRITSGNSLERGSLLDDLNGRVDVVLTNPPFGARFDAAYLASGCGDNTPFFSRLRRASTVDSELLFVDRDLQLLREGGRLLIVVPDGVVSAKGMAALLRQHVAGVATVRAVIALPAVTFAQAGTRTKTAILYLQKGRAAKPRPAFVATSRDLGFQVSSRKGVQVKVPKGESDLPAILEAYRRADKVPVDSEENVVSHEPSCVVVPEATLLRGTWTPNHYSAARLEAVGRMRGNGHFDLVPLGRLVEFRSDGRRAEPWRPGLAFISVLHLLGEGLVDVKGALNNSPKTPGLPTEPGDLLMSRINPRIPRVCVTPDLGLETLCSSEIEVMTPGADVDVYTLAYLLHTEVVQAQVRSLTSGTSASHNRIRTSELAKVLVPIPPSGSKRARALEARVDEYRRALESMIQAAATLAKIRTMDPELFAVE